MIPRLTFDAPWHRARVAVYLSHPKPLEVGWVHVSLDEHPRTLVAEGQVLVGL